MHRIGNVIVEESVDRESFIEIIKKLDLKPPVIIKPNWGFSVCFTEATILDWVFSAIDGDALIVESYGWARTEDALKSEGWGSIEPEDLRDSDRWFLKYSGIGEIMKKHGVEFLNITEENWRGRTATPELIKDEVARKHPPIERQDFYGFVPERVYEMRGSDLLSLAKVRVLEAPMYVSLAVKNFFGMIPGPSRGTYHGEKHSKLNQSIVDIYKVYDSLFNISGVIEAVLTASLRDPETLKWDTIENPGFLSSSGDPLELDAFVTVLLGIDPTSVGYLRTAAETFGGWNEESVAYGLKSGIEIFARNSTYARDKHPALHKLLLKKHASNYRV
ncbi:MAG: DUF362 domain-containing protein [Candidatus Bathyarchaeia archaeon]